MLVHHFFFSFLDGKTIDSTTEELSPVLRDQRNVNFIGTAIAHGARMALSKFHDGWHHLRSGFLGVLDRGGALSKKLTLFSSLVNPHTILPRSEQQPYPFVVSLVSCVASVMALIVIIVPGSPPILNVPHCAQFRRIQTSWNQDTNLANSCSRPSQNSDIELSSPSLPHHYM